MVLYCPAYSPVVSHNGYGSGPKAQGPKAVGSSPKRVYKALTDYTKPQNIIQSPDRLYKAPTKRVPSIQSSTKTIQRVKTLDKTKTKTKNLKMFNNSSNKYYFSI